MVTSQHCASHWSVFIYIIFSLKTQFTFIEEVVDCFKCERGHPDRAGKQASEQADKRPLKGTLMGFGRSCLWLRWAL